MSRKDHPMYRKDHRGTGDFSPGNFSQGDFSQKRNPDALCKESLFNNESLPLYCAVNKNLSLFGGSPASSIFERFVILCGLTISAWQADVEVVQN